MCTNPRIDAQVNVNWGSKSTQFHGSLGKAAAAAANQSATPPGSSPDDDGRARISWRGDAAFFALSTLDPYGLCHFTNTLTSSMTQLNRCSESVDGQMSKDHTRI